MIYLNGKVVEIIHTNGQGVWEVTEVTVKDKSDQEFICRLSELTEDCKGEIECEINTLELYW